MHGWPLTIALTTVNNYLMSLATSLISTFYIRISSTSMLVKTHSHMITWRLQLYTPVVYKIQIDSLYL